MFTIKFYDSDNFRQRILEAESFTILRSEGGGTAEITLHRPSGPNGEYNDVRYDIDDEAVPHGHEPARFARAIIENAAGKTTEIISLRPLSRVA